ncbi:MAG: hypothetical protein JXR07_08525 [Reichenbachiella sp.]
MRSRSFVKSTTEIVKRFTIGRLAVAVVVFLRDTLRYRLPSDELFIKRRFKKVFNRSLNLDDPQTLSEKLQWLKLYDRTEFHTLCADKYAVRKYVEETIGSKYLIPLVYHSKNPDHIVDENMPDFPFVIKVNHDSSGVIIVKDKSLLDYKSTRETLKKWLKSNYYLRKKEWQYKNIPPRIIVEKLLLEKNGAIPNDYKFHVFNNKVKIIQVDQDRHINHKRVLYDESWNEYDFEWGFPKGSEEKKPTLLEEAISLAEKLSGVFCYARVDFYIVNNKLYFGEITFHPGSGFELFSPENHDYLWGSELVIPTKRIKNER